jgi:hypothetical protein
MGLYQTFHEFFSPLTELGLLLFWVWRVEPPLAFLQREVEVVMSICFGASSSTANLIFWRSSVADSPRLILGLGANVEYASAVFLNLFPRAFVLAVEPDPTNVEI